MVVALIVVWHDGSPPGVDLAVHEFFVRRRDGLLFGLSRAVARLGGREVVVPLGVVGAGLLAWRDRSWAPLVLLVATYFIAAAPVAFLKEWLHRPEPLDLSGEIGRSFPSGHAAQALAVYGAVAFASRRRAAAVFAGAAAFGVGAAMVVRDAHWLTDVVGGWAIAGAALVVTTAAATRWHARRHPAGVGAGVGPAPPS